MENSFKISVTRRFGEVCKTSALLFIFVISATQRMVAQAEPSLSNVKKTLQLQEKQAHDEFMSYVYMVLGFAVVIAIAWVSTVKARKRSREENEAKMKILQHNLAHKKHNPDPHYHGHGHTLHKVKR